jgi:hypothetical protein
VQEARDALALEAFALEDAPQLGMIGQEVVKEGRVAALSNAPPASGKDRDRGRPPRSR